MLAVVELVERCLSLKFWFNTSLIVFLCVERTEWTQAQLERRISTECQIRVALEEESRYSLQLEWSWVRRRPKVVAVGNFLGRVTLRCGLGVRIRALRPATLEVQGLCTQQI